MNLWLQDSFFPILCCVCLDFVFVYIYCAAQGRQFVARALSSSGGEEFFCIISSEKGSRWGDLPPGRS